MSFKILGTGSFLPKRVVTNEELSGFLDTSDEWISQRVGVKTRHVCVTETAADMAAQAAEKALEMAGVAPQELDMILCATAAPDSVVPSLACSTQMMLGAECPAMDINAACSGFIYTLDTAAGFFARKKAKKVLVVGAERLSRVVDWTDRSTCVILGDGAGAVVLGEGDGYLSSKLFARGNDVVIRIPLEGGKSPYYENESPAPFFYMNGKETFKFAVGAMCGDLTEVICDAGLTLDHIKWFVPHQANGRIIDAATKKLEIPPERCCKNIERVGNTSSASIPILLDELMRDGKLEDGDYIALTSFGGGLTSAACVIRW